jgi:hypothetical protein
MKKQLGWIIVHSEEEYAGTTYGNPIAQLKVQGKPGKLWHWRTPKPLRVDGPYTLLFAWKGEVFGEGNADVTHKITNIDYNFAFKLHDYSPRKLVGFDKLPLGTRRQYHRSLIVLDSNILAAYNKLK